MQLLKYAYPCQGCHATSHRIFCSIAVGNRMYHFCGKPCVKLWKKGRRVTGSLVDALQDVGIPAPPIGPLLLQLGERAMKIRRKKHQSTADLASWMRAMQRWPGDCHRIRERGFDEHEM